MLMVSVLFVIYSVCVMFYIGGNHCGICWGTCCPLVNTMLSALVEAGELCEDAEVGVSVLLRCMSVYFVNLEYPGSHSGLYD